MVTFPTPPPAPPTCSTPFPFQALSLLTAVSRAVCADQQIGSCILIYWPGDETENQHAPGSMRALFWVSFL